MFLRQRSWILGIKPTRTIDLRKYYSEDVIDTMQLWSNWGFRKFVKLEVLGDALGCGCKTGHGTDVAQWWAARDFASIATYCMEDVRLTYRVFCRLMYQQPRTTKPRARNKQRPCRPNHLTGPHAPIFLYDLESDHTTLLQGASAIKIKRQITTLGSVSLGMKFIWSTVEILGPQYAKPYFEGQVLTVVGFKPGYKNKVVVQLPSREQCRIRLEMAEKALSLTSLRV
jgi:hypothetical protein